MYNSTADCVSISNIIYVEDLIGPVLLLVVLFGIAIVSLKLLALRQKREEQ